MWKELVIFKHTLLKQSNNEIPNRVSSILVFTPIYKPLDLRNDIFVETFFRVGLFYYP